MSGNVTYRPWLWFAVDGALWLGCMALALMVRFTGNVPGSEWEFFWRFIPLSGGGMLLSFYGSGVYRPGLSEDWAWRELWWGCVTGISGALAILFLLKIPYSRWAFLVGAISFFSLVVLSRVCSRIVAEWLGVNPPVRVSAVGFPSDTLRKRLEDALRNNVTVRYAPADLGDPSFDYLQKTEPDVILLNGNELENRFIRRVSDFGSRMRIPVRVYPSSGELFLSQTTTESWHELRLLRSDLHHRLQQQLALKSLFDYVLGGLLFLISLPLMATIALLILLADGRPVLYRQTRVGKGGDPFEIHKFRTMVPDADSRGPDLTEGPDDPRITPLGKVLRRLSLDELPQLWDVVRGRMSLVGPRPEIPSITCDYNNRQQRVFWLKPGLTGLSQVSGRDELELDEKLRIDQFYLNDYSIGLDLWILLRTLVAVLRGRGTN